MFSEELEKLSKTQGVSDHGSLPHVVTLILAELKKKLEQTVLKVNEKAIIIDVYYYLVDYRGWIPDFMNKKRGILFRCIGQGDKVTWLNPYDRHELLIIMSWLIANHCMTPSGKTVHGWETVTKYAPY